MSFIFSTNNKNFFHRPYHLPYRKKNKSVIGIEYCSSSNGREKKRVKRQVMDISIQCMANDSCQYSIYKINMLKYQIGKQSKTAEVIFNVR